MFPPSTSDAAAMFKSNIEAVPLTTFRLTVPFALSVVLEPKKIPTPALAKFIFDGTVVVATVPLRMTEDSAVAVTPPVKVVVPSA